MHNARYAAFPPPPPLATPLTPLCKTPPRNSPFREIALFGYSPGRILTEEEFRTEATVKYDGLSVEAATRDGKLEAYSAPPNAALTVLGSGLFAFLQGRIAATCRNVYPVVRVLAEQRLHAWLEYGPGG